MKFLGIEIPPSGTRKAELDEAEKAPQLPEYMPHEKPAAFDSQALIDRYRDDKDTEAFLNAIDAQIDAWQEYATDHDVFASKDLQAMRRARMELKKDSALAEVAQMGMRNEGPAVDEVREKLDEIFGTLASNVGEAVEKNENRKRAERIQESTHAEQEQSLSTAVEELKKQPFTKNFSKGNEKVENVRNSVESERTAMEAAESAYLAAYKEHYSQKGAKAKNGPEQLAVLKRSYDEARIAYGTAFTESVRERIAARKGTKRELNEREAFELQSRYNRLVRYNEIIKPAAEKRYQARVEAMGTREKGMFAKGMEKLAAGNAWLESKLGKNGAKAARITATTLVVGAPLALGGAGIVALAGWGSIRVARILASAGIAEGVASAYGKLRGTRVEKKLNYVGRTGHDLSLEELEEIDTDRAKWEKQADPQVIARQKMLVRSLTAIGLGAGTSAMLSDLPSMHGALEEGTTSHSGGTSMGTASGIENHNQLQGLHDGTAAPIEKTETSVHEHTAHKAPAVHHAPERHTAPHTAEPKPNAYSEQPASTPIEPEQANAQVTVHEAVSEPETNAAEASVPEVSQPIAETGATAHEADGSVSGESAANPVVPVEAPSEEVAPATPEVSEVPTAMPTETPSAEPVATIPAPENVPPPSAADIHTADATSEAIPSPETSATPAFGTADQTVDIAPEQPVEVGAAMDSHSDISSVSSPEGVTDHPAMTAPSVSETEPTSAHVPDRAPVRAAPETGGSILNSHGVDVNPSVAHLYESSSVKGYAVLWGGTNEQKDALINSFYAKPENEGKILMYISQDKSMLTGQNRVGFYSINGPQVNTVGRFGQVKAPTLDSFTKIIQ